MCQFQINSVKKNMQKTKNFGCVCKAIKFNGVTIDHNVDKYCHFQWVKEEEKM